MTKKLFNELGLSDEVLKGIDKLGFEQAAPIQALAIPELLAGRDVVGQSQTGSGKTAAFAIPAIEKTRVEDRVVQALILCPTRELAVQISEEIHKLAQFKRGLNVLPIYGGQSYDRQLYGLKQGAHIVIGTPGRVMDHMRRGTLRLDAVRFAVLDEVDVMLNMGFRDDIESILEAVPKERQTVFFSATIPQPIRQMIQRYARNPKEIRIEQKALTVPTVEQVYYEVDPRFKVELLERLIDVLDLKLGLIFCNTKRMVDELADRLEAAGYMADRLHGDMTQNMRDRVMNKFRKSGLEFLVATDVAARGIDVNDIEVVFNYDLPYDGEDYVHRIGRTGRAGRAGRAISFVSGRELFQIRNIERYANTRIHRSRIPTEQEVEEARRSAFLARLRAMLQSRDYGGENPVLVRLLDEGFLSTEIASACIALLERSEPSSKRSRKDEPRPAPKAAAPVNEGKVEPRPAPKAAVPVSERKTEPVPSPPADRVVKSPPPAEPRKAEPRKIDRPRAADAFRKKKERRQPPPAWVSAKRGEPRSAAAADPAPKVKASRATPPHQSRLWMNLGEAMDITPHDIVNAIAGETGLPVKVVGAVDVRERHLFADVSREHANGIVSKLNRTSIKGHRVKVKIA